MTYLIVGLGNPDLKYQETRHNTGYLALDQIPGLSWTKEKKGLLAREGNIIFLKPTTYMNLSGEAVRYWMAREKIPLSNVLIICDDLDLDLGKMKIKAGGGSSHNGLRNIAENLGTNAYARLRVGIKTPEFKKEDQVDFVLGDFSSAEKESLNLPQVLDIIKSFIESGIDKTMNTFNRKG